MPAFDYTAIDTNGRKQKGILEADSARSVRQLLRDQKFTPLDVKEASVKNTTDSFWQRSHHISGNDLALLTRQIATLLQAGLSIEDGLSAVAQQSESKSVERVILAVRASVREGHSLADSLEKFPKAFPNLYCASVAAGEQSGHLVAVLNRLADYTEEQLEFKQKIQLALVYPILLFVLSLLIVVGLMVYVIPDIVSVILDAGQQLPLLTEILVSVSNFIAHWGVVLLSLLVITYVAIRWLLTKPAIQLSWHSRLLKLPFIKRFSRGANASRYISTLAILTNSGIPLVDAMRIASAVVSNLRFKNELHTASQQVREGISLNRSLTNSGNFPPMMLHLIASGETSGELPAMLQRAANIQEKELQRIVTTIVAVFEPAILVIMGGFVLTIVLAVMLPILNLNQLVN